MQNYQDLSDTTAIENQALTISILTGSTAPELQQRVEAGIAAFLLANPSAALVDLAFAGGAAGGLLMVKMILTPTPGQANFPPLNQIDVAIREAPDQLSMNVAMGTYRASLPPSAALVAYDAAIMGAGAVFCFLQAWLVEQG